MLKNITPGTVLLIGAISLSTGWLAGTSSSSNQNQEAASARPRTGPRPLGSPASVAPLTRQLRERLDKQPPRTPATGRNPFHFGTRLPTTVTRYRDAPVAALAPPRELETFTPPAPQIKLSGVASSLEAGVTVWTAIINDNGALAFVNVGDKLSTGATVSRIDETTVVLVDQTGASQTLRLP